MTPLQKKSGAAWKAQFAECSAKRYTRNIGRGLVRCQHPDQDGIEYCNADTCILINGRER